MNALQDKVVLITGAGRGIGRGHALTLAREGASVVVNDRGGADADSDKRVSDEVVELITDAGGCAVADYSDVSTWAGAQAAVQTGIDAYGRLDGLVNNAGVLLNTDFVSCTEEQFDIVMNVHVKATFACMHWAMSHWRDVGTPRGSGRSIVNTVSDAMLLGLADPVYGAAKAAIAHLTLVGGVDGETLGVRTNAVAPRAATRMSRASGLMDYTNAGPVLEADQADPGEPSHPANASPIVAWLLSDLSRHVNGQVFRTLGGGFTVCRPWTYGDIVYPPGDQHVFTVEQVDKVANATLYGTQFVRRRLDFAPGDKRSQKA